MNDFDRQLVRRVKNGDEAAFKLLFFNHYHGLCALAEQITKSKELARDVVQDVFLKIWRGRSDFSIELSLEAYLCRAVRNQALVVLEKQRSQGRIKNEFAKELTQSFEVEQNELEMGAQPKIVEQIWKIVETLPTRRRMAFTLHHKQGLTYKEISNVMDVSQKTVETHIGLALKEIRSHLQQKFVDA
jgi:RNA polymerase sigma-70 factor (ECF subfamily)